MNDELAKADQTAALLRVVRLLTPHPGVDAAVFDRTVDHVVSVASRDDGLRSLLHRHLDDLVSRAFVSLGDAEAQEILTLLQGTAFFRFLRSEAVGFFYSEMDVYAVIGYEGPSFDKGGYLERGFDDLSWLPDPYETEAASK